MKPKSTERATNITFQPKLNTQQGLESDAEQLTSSAKKQIKTKRPLKIRLTETLPIVNTVNESISLDR